MRLVFSHTRVGLVYSVQVMREYTAAEDRKTKDNTCIGMVDGQSAGSGLALSLRAACAVGRRYRQRNSLAERLARVKSLVEIDL